MANIRPFAAVRPTEEKAQQVAALPYDVYSSAEAREAVQGKPYSFLNIDRAETQFGKNYDIYATEVYEKADEMLLQWQKQGILIQDEQPCYYIYELIMDGRSQTGIVGAASIDDYIRGVCKKHENTVAAKEQDRIKHVDVTSAHTGPIFLAYRNHEGIDAIVQQQKKKIPLYAFTSEDKVSHRIWKVDDEKTVRAIRDAFSQVDSTYIADGHHRNASAVKVGLKRREANPQYTGEEEFNYYLAICFPEQELKIMAYNRFVRDLNGYTNEEFLKKLAESFEIQPLPKASHPKTKGTVHMYLDGKWYALTVRKEIMKRKKGPVETLDVSVLQDECLGPILGIKDPRNNARIKFVGGIRGLNELKRLVDQTKGSVAFAMFPTKIEELFAVADAGLLMPPKSTWFEPKPRSGLLIHRFER